MKILPRITLGILIALLLPSGGALAHGGGGGGGGDQRRSAPPSPPSKDFIKAWNALLAARDGIAEDIEAGRLDSIHDKAGVVPELAQALMQQTGDLSDAKRARVKSGVTQLSKVAEHLRMVAGTGGVEVLRGDLKRIDRAVRLIRAQYSEGSLPLGAQSAAGHAEGHHD